MNELEIRNEDIRTKAGRKAWVQGSTIIVKEWGPGTIPGSRAYSTTEEQELALESTREYRKKVGISTREAREALSTDFRIRLVRRMRRLVGLSEEEE